MSFEEDSWLQELDETLNGLALESSDEDLDHISDVSRPNVWQTCLDVINVNSKMISFDDIFDLPEQKLLREDCQNFVSKLGNKDEDKISVLSDLESILTCYCKVDLDIRKYKQNNGWIDLMLPLITLKLPRADTYNMFEVISDRYIPRHIDAFHLLRLLILYHDPQLCSFLDTKKVTPEVYSKTWFCSLFAAVCDLPVILSMWDLYLHKGDSFFIFYLSLVILINARETVLSMIDDTRTHIIEVMSSLPCSLRVEDVGDFCALAQYYNTKTPTSFKQKLQNIIFGDEITDKASILFQALCLPVSAEELITTQTNHKNSDTNEEDSVRFFLIDCRAAEQYNAGHPATAFHLDCNLMLQEPNSFSTAVHGLLSCQRQALAIHSNAGGEHLCFLGCGELDNDQYTHMVVASFLQKHIHFVSILEGGYKSFHAYLKTNVDEFLQDHNPEQCLVCLSNNKHKNIEISNKKTDNKFAKQNGQLIDSPTAADYVTDTFGKIFSDIFGNVVKTKSVEVKEKLYEYITNPNSGNQSNKERHVSSTDKLGKRYRNLASVFSIDEDHDVTDVADTDTSSDSHEIVRISSFTKEPHIIMSVKCQGVNMNNYIYDCYLVVTKTHLMVLCETEKKDYARITVNRLLASVLKITCKKKHPELVTFQYGDSSEVTDMDRFLIPNSGEVTKIISKQIMDNVKT